MVISQLNFYLFHQSEVIIVELCPPTFKIPIVGKLSKINVSSRIAFIVHQTFIKGFDLIDNFYLFVQFLYFFLEFIFAGDQTLQFGLH